MTPRTSHREEHLELVAQLRAKLAAAALGGSGTCPRTSCQPGQAASARPRRRAARPGQPVPRTDTACRRWHVRRRMPRRGHDRRYRPRLGTRMHDRRQRRDGEGRHLLPDHRQEAPARAGDRRAEPAAVHLPGRLRWGVPAAAGRGVPRPRALRSHLLQPGQPVRRGHPADRGGAGLVHRRRRICARDERRGRDRAQPGHHLPRRPAAGEGRDRRGGHRRGSRRR